jgi:hypothetical protein
MFKAAKQGTFPPRANGHQNKHFHENGFDLCSSRAGLHCLFPRDNLEIEYADGVTANTTEGFTTFLN